VVEEVLFMLEEQMEREAQAEAALDKQMLSELLELLILAVAAVELVVLVEVILSVVLVEKVLLF
jgi:hypothetical protein